MAFCLSLCKNCCALETCVRAVLLQMLLPTNSWDHKGPCKRMQITAPKSAPWCWIFAPLVSNFIVSVCCWQQHFQQDGVFAAFKCKTIFAEEFAKRKIFFWQIVVQIAAWGLYICSGRKCWKNIWCCATLSAKLVVHSKAAKTPLRWKCCCQPQIQTITFLKRGWKFQHGNLDQSVEISFPLVAVLPYPLSSLLLQAPLWTKGG